MSSALPGVANILLWIVIIVIILIVLFFLLDRLVLFQIPLVLNTEQNYNNNIMSLYDNTLTGTGILLSL